MKVDSAKAISSIIAYKEAQRKQEQLEDKLMVDIRGNRNDAQKKLEESMIKASGLTKKDLNRISKATKKDFERSFEAFKNSKRPKKEPTQHLLPGFATAFNKPGDDLQHPGDNDGPHTLEPPNDIPQAICFTSAIRCVGNACERQNAAMFPAFESDSMGGYFGNLAVAVQADRTNSLYYLFVPTQTGTANILAEVLLNGFITLATAESYSLNFFFPVFQRCMADVKFSLRMNVWKGNTIISTTPVPIVDVHCQDGETKFIAFRNDLFVLQTSTIVTEEEWIVIEIEAVANIIGRSHLGVATVDFSKGRKISGFDSGIRVPQLCVFVNPL